MSYRDRNPQPVTLKDLKRREKLAKSQRETDLRNEVNAGFDLRRQRLNQKGASRPFSAAMPEVNRRSSIYDVDRANERFKQLEAKHLYTQPAQPAAPMPQAAVAQKAAEQPTFARNTEMSEKESLMAIDRQRQLRAENPNMPEADMDKIIQSELTAHRATVSPGAAAAPAAPQSTDPWLDQMKAKHGPTTRREGDFYRTFVPSESGPRGIDIPRSYEEGRSADTNANWSNLKPSQRAALLMNGQQPTAVRNQSTVNGVPVTDFRKQEQDPRGMNYLNKLGDVTREQVEARMAQKADPTAPFDYSKTGSTYAKQEAASRAAASPSMDGVPADASRAITTDYGPAGFARDATPKPATTAAIPQWQQDVLKTNPMVGVAGSQSNKDFAGSYKAAGGDANDFNPGVLESMAAAAGNAIVNPTGGAPKPSALPQQTPGGPPKPGAIPATAPGASPTGLPTFGGAIKVQPQTPRPSLAESFKKEDEILKKRPQFQGFGNISWK